MEYAAETERMVASCVFALVQKTRGQLASIFVRQIHLKTRVLSTIHLKQELTDTQGGNLPRKKHCNAFLLNS